MEKEFGICDIELYNNCIKYMFLRFYSCGATSQTQCLQGTESSFVFDDCAQVAEHPVDARLATTEAERRPNTPPLGAELAKEPNGSFGERKSGKVQDEKRVATMCKIMKDMRNEAALNKEIKVN